MCGGTTWEVAGEVVTNGLSPRVRGNRARFIRPDAPYGLSPRVRGNPDMTSPRVYPRVCGGTMGELKVVWDKRGLSPRVRGNHQLREAGRLVLRSIPACAGEPYHTPHSTTHPQVYPRVCGGTSPFFRLGLARYGLSPRVRGNRVLSGESSLGHRSIPACAGEPYMPSCPTRSTTVYPRVCGGTGLVLASSSSQAGLSPRVRGNLVHPERHNTLSRSIPACAGEPHVCHVTILPFEVYPRVCGGTPVA